MKILSVSLDSLYKIKPDELEFIDMQDISIFSSAYL
jgi:hypothetical protein